MEQRRDLGRLLLGLRYDAPGLVLRQRGAELQRLFPADEIVQHLASHLVVATRESPEEVAKLCERLRDHVADSYRIHHRLIRSRRADAKGWEFMPRGPVVDGEPKLTHVRTESLEAEKVQPLLASLEDWRFAAFEATVGDEVALVDASRRYAALLGAVALGGQALNEWLKSAIPSFAGEAEILEALWSSTPEDDEELRVQTMVESTSRFIKTIRTDTAHPKVVVFASTNRMASLFHDRLKDFAGDVRVHLMVEGAAADAAEILDSFKEPRKAAFLVTDRSGEEGLNLSMADAIVHLDLPMSAARLEQRIGRLDRFGRRQSVIRHRILLPSDEDGSPWATWLGVLATAS